MVAPAHLALAAFLLFFGPSGVGGQESPVTRGSDPAPALHAGLEEAGWEDYHESVGRKVEGTHVIELEAREVAWRPWGEDGPPILAHAWAADGEKPRVPAPLIRVRAGTPVEVTIRNTFDTDLFVRGLRGGTRPRPGPGPGGGPPLPDSVVVPPGDTKVARFTPTVPGTYVYTGRVGAPFPFFGGEPRPDILGGGQGNRQWIGLMVVDPAEGPLPEEAFFLITHWGDPRVPSSFLPATRFFINGRAWPHTRRLEYAQGDTVRWRVVNMSGREHPMHLHGFHFQVDGRGDQDGDGLLPPELRPHVVTETLEPGGSVRMSWVASEPGNWVFHCHFMRHMSWIQNRPMPEGGGADGHDRGHSSADQRAMASAGEHHDPAAVGDRQGTELLGGLVMGITIHPSPDYRAVQVDPVRELRLHVTRTDRVFGDEPGYSFVLQRGASPAPDSLLPPSSPLILTRDELTRITVLNHADAPLGVHWHGIELESWADGVPGWSGMPDAPVPAVSPGDSLVVRMSPPRAGTFMYHVHSEPGHELARGLYGTLLVMEPGQVWDRTRDHPFLLGSLGTGKDPPPAVNGRRIPSLVKLEMGVTNRLRFMHISPDDDKQIRLLQDGDPVTWTPVAKDGADLPPALVREGPAELRIHVAETWDMMWTPREAGSYTLRVVTTFDSGAAAFPRDAPPPHTLDIPVRVGQPGSSPNGVRK
jgi:manganese oxidase